MITKIYGVFGYREACLTVPVSGDGKSYLKIEFTGGNPQHGAYYRAATYVCPDRTEQAMIEGSIMFGDTIKLIKQFGTEEPEAKTPAKAVSNTNADGKEQGDSDNKEVATFPDVTNVDELRVVLKAKGAKAPTLTSENAMMRFAEANGLSFPNLVL